MKRHRGRARHRRGKRKPSLAKKVKRLSRAVKKVKDLAEQGTGELLYRERFTYQLQLIATNEANYNSFNLCAIQAIERSLGAVKFYDPAAPATLVTTNVNTGTFQREYLFHNSYQMVIRNNFVVPVKLRMYIVVPKTQTSLTPEAAITAGYNDKGTGLLSSALMYFSDSDIFTQTWRIVKSKICILQGGSQINWSYHHPVFKYDPTVEDTFNENFYPQYGGASLLARIEGVIGHDNVTPTLVGSMAVAIDVQTTSVFRILYDAGVNLKNIVVNDSSATIAYNGATITQKPQAINQIFLVS